MDKKQENIERAAEYLCVACMFITDEKDCLVNAQLDPQEAIRMIEDIVDKFKSDLLT